MLWADHALLGERRRSLIRKVAATELVSVDCVMEAPEEWTLSSNQVSEAANPSNMTTSDALLLGCVTTRCSPPIGRTSRAEDIGIVGSSALLRSLLAGDPLDGRAKAHRSPPCSAQREAPPRGRGYRKALKVVDSKTFGTGDVSLTYRPAGRVVERAGRRTRVMPS